MARGTMKLLDANTGEMQCRVCGSRHFANIRPNSGGQFYRGAWQCIERDRHPDPEDEKAGAIEPSSR